MRALTFSLVLFALGVAGCVAEAPDESTASAESAIKAKKLRYQVVDVTAGPPEAVDGWFPAGLSDAGEVFGQALDCDDEFIVCSLDVFKRSGSGEFTLLAEDFSISDVTGRGDVGGCTIDDPATFFGQAAVLTSRGTLELIPRLPGEVTSCVIKLSDAGVAVVSSFTETFEQTVYVLDRNRITPFTLPLASVEDVNDHGVIAGVVFTPDANRAYRFDSRTETTTILDPVPPDPHSWGLGINRHGEVLGYSFVFNGIERIGKWNRENEFETHFIEGIPEFPTISNRLVWNEDGLIVISQTTDGNTYLVPEPGIRLDLADLVVDGEAPSSLFVLQLNQRADFLAFGLAEGTSYLFQRTPE
jgi:hypothetical protein